MSFMLRSGAATGAVDATAGVGAGEGLADAAGAGAGPGKSALDAAAGEADGGEPAGVGLAPPAANEDNPKRTAPARALRYVQACMGEDSTPTARPAQPRIVAVTVAENNTQRARAAADGEENAPAHASLCGRRPVDVRGLRSRSTGVRSSRRCGRGC